MAKMDLSEGFPMSRTVDGVDTEAVADHLGYANQFGSPRRCHRDYVDSKTGKRAERPGHADPDYKPEGGY